MKAVLMSIQPKWCEKIANGEKTIEVRKTRPKLETPFKVYIYATWNGSKKEIFVKQDGQLFCEDWRKSSGLQRASGKVIGEFVCDRITEYECSSDGFGELATTCGTCLTYDEILNYCNGNDLYGWRITDLKIYNNPKELGNFAKAYPIKCGKGYESIDCSGCGSEFTCNKRFITRPPQSWYYVEELQNG